MLEVTLFQDVAAGIHVALPGRPQHQPADGVGEAGAGGCQQLLFEPGGGFVVGRQQHLEGGAVGDLGVELAGRPEGQLGLVAGVPLELGGDLLHGGREVGGHRHGDFLRVGGHGEQQWDEQGGEAFHGGSPVQV